DLASFAAGTAARYVQRVKRPGNHIPGLRTRFEAFAGNQAARKQHDRQGGPYCARTFHRGNNLLVSSTELGKHQSIQPEGFTIGLRVKEEPCSPRLSCYSPTCTLPGLPSSPVQRMGLSTNWRITAILVKR